MLLYLFAVENCKKIRMSKYQRSTTLRNIRFSRKKHKEKRKCRNSKSIICMEVEVSTRQSVRLWIQWEYLKEEIVELVLFHSPKCFKEVAIIVLIIDFHMWTVHLRVIQHIRHRNTPKEDCLIRIQVFLSNIFKKIKKLLHLILMTITILLLFLLLKKTKSISTVQKTSTSNSNYC